jgi:hypothetical protein
MNASDCERKIDETVRQQHHDSTNGNLKTTSESGTIKVLFNNGKKSTESKFNSIQFNNLSKQQNQFQHASSASWRKKHKLPCKVKPNSVTHNQIQQKHSETPKH